MKYFLRAQPQSKNRMTQKFGARPNFYAQFGLKGHEGIDLNDAIGKPTPVYAVENGIITIRRGGAYGNRVDLKFKHLLFSYCHLSDIFVKNGQKVKAGDKIAMTGDTASYDMPIHLHFMCKELDDKGKVINKGNGYAGSVKIELDSNKKLFVHITKPVHNPDMYKGMKQYRGLKVFYKDQPKSSATRNAMYDPYKKAITIYPNFFTQIIPKQRAILDHEFCHHVQFYRLPYNFVEAFIDLYNYDGKLISKFNERSDEDFDGKKFLNSHASKKWTEDMAEQIEHRVLIEEGVEQLPEKGTLLNKYRFSCSTYDKYKNKKDKHRDIDVFIKRYIL